jgi:hypothetical protein
MLNFTSVLRFLSFSEAFLFLLSRMAARNRYFHHSRKILLHGLEFRQFLTTPYFLLIESVYTVSIDWETGEANCLGGNTIRHTTVSALYHRDL